MNEIADSLTRIMDSRIRYGIHYGIVTTKHAADIDVALAGSSTPVTNMKYLSSFNPQVDDVVVVLVNKNDAIAIGTVHKV